MNEGVIEFRKRFLQSSSCDTMPWNELEVHTSGLFESLWIDAETA